MSAIQYSISLCRGLDNKTPMCVETNKIIHDFDCATDVFMACVGMCHVHFVLHHSLSPQTTKIGWTFLPHSHHLLIMELACTTVSTSPTGTPVVAPARSTYCTLLGWLFFWWYSQRFWRKLI